MTRLTWMRGALLVSAGVIVGVLLAGRAVRDVMPAASAQAPAAGRAAQPPLDIPVDVAHLKDVVPSQSHAMMDVSFHWTNLWFAAQKRNWPLAQFYFDESRQHIQWTIRIRPIRKDADGKDVDLKGIFDGIDTSSLDAVKQAIARKDLPTFTAAYKTMLESCYSCHKASSKPYLRPMVPTAPASTAINFDPNATWPQ
jgi:hypothetical protein